MPSLSDLLPLGTILLCIAAYLYRKSSTSVPLPPGPKGLPIIGAILDFPTSKPWETYKKWANEFGPIMGLRILGQPIIIIDDKEVAFAVLDKTGSAIADRPTTPMLEMTGWTNVLAAQTYGPRFREYRKHFSRAVGSTTAVQRFNPVTTYRAAEFIQNLLNGTNDLETAIRKNVGAIMLFVAYGITLKGEGHQNLLEIAEKGPEEFDIAADPSWLVNTIPILRYLPASFPGAAFKREAERSRKVVFDISDLLFQAAELRTDNGSPIPSLAGDFLSDSPNMTEEQIFNLKWSSGSFFSAGTDTTASATMCFFLAMMVYPEVQAKLQKELDAVVGTGRLPSFEDRANLPYLDAVHKECFRWLPPGPAGVPHRARENVQYGQYVIPEGSIVIANIWSMLHNPDVYKDPFTFNPDRYLGATPEPDPLDVAFGFGRRVCPGGKLAESIVWSFIAHAAATVDVKKPVRNGKVVEPDVGQRHGTVSKPNVFVAAITPRGRKEAQLCEEAISTFEY